MNSSVLTGKEIAKAIQRVEPRRIAVAYLGRRWKEYLPNVDELEAVVISPNLGTDPRSVKELVKRLSIDGQDGWDRVFLHDDLHAKVYLGKTAAVLGSANLSFGGLGDPRRREICSETSLPKDWDVLDQFFETLKKEAKNQYGSASEKKKRLLTLEAEIKSNPYDGSERMASSFEKFELDAPDEFYVAYYTTESLVYTEAGKQWEEKILDALSFAKTDKLDKRKWILCWHLMPKGKPAPANTSNYKWMKVDETLPDGADDDGYPQLVFMRKDWGSYNARCAKAPFKLTPPVIEAFRKAVMDKNISEYLVQGKADFNLRKSIEGVPNLIAAMKKNLGQVG